MTLPIRPRAFVAPLVLAVAASSCTCHETILVTVATPDGAQRELPYHAQFQLDHPIYDPNVPVSKLPEPRLVVQPEVPFSASVSGPFSVEVVFSRALPAATEFAVTLKGGLRSVDGKSELKKDFTTRFTTPLNRVTGLHFIVDGVEGEEQRVVNEAGELSQPAPTLGPKSSIRIDFRYPVSKADAEKLVSISIKDGKVLGGEITPDGQWPATSALFVPGEALTRGQVLVVAVKPGLGVAAPGAGPLLQGRAFAVDVPVFSDQGIIDGPGGEGDGCESAKVMRLELTNPAACDRVLEFLSIDVDNTELKCAGGDASTVRRVIRVEAVPAPPGNRAVTITAKAGLPDAFGGKLNDTRTFTFTTCAPDEALAYQRPFVILDPGQPAEQVERVRNAATLKVEGKRVDLSTLWKAVGDQGIGDQLAWTDLPWWLEYGDEWGDEESHKNPGEMKDQNVPALDGAPSVSIPVPGAAKVSDWRDVSVGLEQFLPEKKGIALLRLQPLGADGKPAARAVLRVVNVTDLGLTARASQDSIVVLAAKYSDGKPLEGVKIRIAGEDGTLFGEGLTTADGTLRMDRGQLGNLGNLHGKSFLVAAAKDSDEAFMWSRFATESVYESEGLDMLGIVYSDRGIYRPGEKVRLRGIIRLASAKGFSSAGATVHLVIEDPQGTQMVSKDVTLSPWGTFTDEFETKAASVIGDWNVRTSLGNSSLWTGFKVGEFRRAEMKVQIQAPERVGWGETLKATVQADYLFGAPAGGLKLHWNVTREKRGYRSKKFERADFDDPAVERWSWSADWQTLADGDAKLDDKGTFNIVQPMKLADPVAQFERIGLSATVDDASGQSVSRQTTVDFFNAGVLLGVQAKSYMSEAKKPLEMTVVAVNPKDEPVAGQAVVLRSRQHSWRSVRREGPGGGLYWTSEEIVENDVERCSGVTGADGRFTCSWTPEHGGSLQLVAETKDAKGRVARGATWQWIYGDSDYWGASSDSNDVALEVESDQVKAGEPIKVAITSPFKEGVALVTVEREDLLWQKSLEIGTNAQLEIPTNPEWAPNVHVVVTVVRGRIPSADPKAPDLDRERPAYAVGRREVKVTDGGRKLEVKVTAAKDHLEPGQEQTAGAVVTGTDGAPVPDVDVNLWAVDEGVLMLVGYQTPDVLAAMYTPRSYRTLGLDTRQYILGKRRFIEPVTKGQEDGGGGGDEQDQTRKNFDPLAVWVGSAITDAAGRVDAKFKVPDNLTTYRVMAVAVSKDDRFGRGDAEFKVNKTLMLRQALPRFTRAGDTFTAGVLVNHLAPGPQTVTVTLDGVDAKLFTVTGDRTKTLELGPNETKPVLFEFAANDVDGASELHFAATMGAYSDKVELKLPVNRVQPRESVAASGVVAAGSKVDTKLTIPPLARATAFTVNTSALPFASLEGRLRDIVSYPYGCLEQKTSKVLPLMAVRKLGEELGLTSIPGDLIKQWVDEYLTLVPRFRCSDGGFDYWEGCHWGSSTYLTSFALDGLLTARRYGFDVKQGEIDRTIEYLKQQVKTGSEGRDQYGGHGHEDAGFAGALRVLAEAGSPEPDIEKAAFEKRGALPLFAKTDLVRAMAWRVGKDAAADAGIKTLLGEITEKSSEKNGALTFPSEDRNKYWWAWDSDRRSTALVLRTLTQIVPGDGRIPLVVKGLIDLDNADPYYVTQDVTQTLLGLVEAIEAMKPKGDGPKATVTVADQKLSTAQALTPKVLALQADTAKLSGDVAVSIANDGGAPLFFGSYLSYAYPATARIPSKDNGFTLKRQYLGKDGKPLPTVKNADGSQTLKLKAGDFVRVSLDVDVKEEGRLVVIEDHLPAGLEVVDTSLATADVAAARTMGDGASERWWENANRQIRDDRVEWDFESVWQTKFQLGYVARAITPGRFLAPGARAERMYQPHVNGRSESIDVVIAPK